MMSSPGDVRHPGELPVRPVGPVPFRVAPLDEVISLLCDHSHPPLHGAGLAVHFANAYSVAIADTDHAYAGVLAAPESAVFSDGVPVTWVGKRAHRDLADRWERVYGPDVMEGVFSRCETLALPIRHYLLGSSPATLQALQSAIGRRWPSVEVVGAESPPFRALTRAEQEAQDDRIRHSGATMVWVGLGTPKQDFEARRLASAVPATVLAVGAAFDFLGGTKPQAPRWMQRTGTEWAYRLAKEPRRLVKRYAWGNPRFLWAAHREPGLLRPPNRQPSRRLPD